MDLRFVKSLIAVIDQGSMAGAARGSNVTAAAISQRISALEAELRVPLLVRQGRQVVATPECDVMLPELRKMLALRNGLPDLLAGDHLQGVLRLGAVSTALGAFGSKIVRGFKEAAPGVELALTPGAARDVFAGFERSELDGALIVAPPFGLPKTMRFDVIAREPIGVLSRKDTPKDAPFILYSRNAWGGAMCWRALEQEIADPAILCEMDAVETITQMVRDGLGQAVLPLWGGLQPMPDGLQFHPLSGVREVGLLTWRRDDRRQVVQLLRDVLGV